MAGVHAALFIIPAANTDELAQLGSLVRDTVNRAAIAEMCVRINQVYRRADELALYRIVLAGDGESAALTGLIHLVYKAGKIDGGTWVFAPDALAALTRGMTALRKRLDDQGLIKQVIKNSLKATPEAARRALAAFEQALAVAAATPDAGFLWSHFYPNAEAEYAEHLAKEAAWRNAPPSPPPTPEQEAEHARIMARLDQMIEDGRRWRFMAQDAPLPASYVIRLLVLEEEKLAELTGGRARSLRIDRNIACRSETGLEREKQRIRALHARLAEHAEVAIELGQYGDTVVLEDVHALLSQRFPAAIQPNGVYNAEQARALDDAARELERQAGGEPAWLEELVNRSHLPRRAYATRAWRGLKKAARAARRKGLVLVWVAA